LHRRPPATCTSATSSAILEDLDWLGFASDSPPVRQSERGAVYEAALGRPSRQTALPRWFRNAFVGSGFSRIGPPEGGPHI